MSAKHCVHLLNDVFKTHFGPLKPKTLLIITIESFAMRPMFAYKMRYALLTAAITFSPIGFAEQSIKAANHPNPNGGSAIDPYESFNRKVFSFNDALDRIFLKPIATFYNKFIPKPLNTGINNFFSNLNQIPNMANDLLQLHIYQFMNDAWRLGVNTTIGIGGLFDVANRIGLKPYNNDFGLTLATWGWKQSNYLVLPFFGPATLRDGLKIPVDYYAFSVYPHLTPKSTRYQLASLGYVNDRAQLSKMQPFMEEVAVDKYAFIRNAYMQRRHYQIQQNANLGNRSHLETRAQ
jgi:phospholipid-binding lipoprotein MlaA